MSLAFRRHPLARGAALFAALVGGAALTLDAVLPAATAASVTAANTAWLDKVDSTLVAAAQQGGAVPFVIQLAGSADLSMAAAAKTREAKGTITVQLLKAHAASAQSGLLQTLAARGLRGRSFWIANAVSATGTLADLQALAARPDVAHIFLVKPERVALPKPGGTAAVDQAELQSVTLAGAIVTTEAGAVRVKAPEVWALGFTGQGVVVGDHDIGVEWTHPALKKKYRGWNETTQTASHDYNWRNAFEVDPYCADAALPCDPNQHGTHTTGTMVGEEIKANGDRMQIGMAPGAQWMACRSLLDDVVGAGTVPTYMDCMEFMLAPFPIGDTAGGDATKAPDVVNNSWGCLEACAPPLLKDINDATEAAGIIQVVSAGNDGSQCSTIISPLAVYDSSFTVGASNTNDEGMASFSSRGPVLVDASMRTKPNVVAPGVGTISSVPGGGYGALSGTSMAGPHVAGQVALILSAEPRLKGRVREVRRLIEATTLKTVASTQTCGGIAPATLPNNVFGFGRIDALASVLARPMLDATVAAPASAKLGTEYVANLTVKQPAAGKLDVTAAKLTVTLPAGVTLVSSSVPEDASTTSDPLKASFVRGTALAPGAEWALSLTLKGTSGGDKAITLATEADQVSPKAGGSAVTSILAGPTPFTFLKRENVALDTFVTSEEVTLAGFTGNLPISVSEGGQYRLNGGAFTNAAGTAKAGDTLAVRHVSAKATKGTTTSTVTVGDYATPFVTVTTDLDAVPDAFGFATKTEQTGGTKVSSEAITLVGFNTAIPVVPGPGLEASIAGGPFSAARAMLSPGQTLTVRHTANTAKLGYTRSSVKAGGVTGTFLTRTKK